MLLTLEDVAREILALSPGEQALAAAAAVKIYGAANTRTAAQMELERGAEEWLRKLFPEYFFRKFAKHHLKFWEWAWSIVWGKTSRAENASLQRGQGKG